MSVTFDNDHIDGKKQELENLETNNVIEVGISEGAAIDLSNTPARIYYKPIFTVLLFTSLWLFFITGLYANHREHVTVNLNMIIEYIFILIIVYRYRLLRLTVHPHPLKAVCGFLQ